MYLMAATAAGAAWYSWRGPHRTANRLALAAIAAGGATFVPWVPTLWFQLHHTGTPWGTPADFTALVYTFTQFAGGNSDPGRALALVLGLLALLGLAGAQLDRRHVVLDLRTRPGVRSLALVSAGTLVLAVIVAKLTASTFADRYSAVILVPCLLVVAYGVTTLADRRVQQGAIAFAVAVGLAASIPNAFILRTQAGETASAVLAGAHPGDVVAYCPDQLGPGVSRLLDGRYDEVSFPRANRPEIVDWVDYSSVVEHASPSAFVRLIEARAGTTHTIWYVWAPGYLSYGADCQTIANELAQHRAQQVLVAETAPDTPFEIFEGESLYRYPPR
jgi:mannosyltransferase